MEAGSGGVYVAYATKGRHVLITIAVILLILAVLGGIAVHPLLFAIALLALLVFVFNGRGRGRAVR